jgi:vacuolar-type H+-ATPase subunit E/Vma4
MTTVASHALTTPDLTPMRAELEPVRQALLADAQARADRILDDAVRGSDLETEGARQDADAEIERATRRGAATAQARISRQLATARDVAHHQILETKNDIRNRFRDAVHDAALDLRSDIRYPTLLDQLERLARDQLGAHARIERDPAELGGIVAIDGSRRVDYTLPALAERALDSIADRVTELWT